jgi:hypothetical protein
VVHAAAYKIALAVRCHAVPSVLQQTEAITETQHLAPSTQFAMAAEFGGILMRLSFCTTQPQSHASAKCQAAQATQKA